MISGLRADTGIPDSRTQKQWRLALFWAVLGAFSAAAVLPYAFALNPALQAAIPLPLPIFLILQIAQTGVMLFLLSWLGLSLGASVGLDSPWARALVSRTSLPPVPKRTLILAIVTGAAIAILILLLDKGFQTFMPLPTQAMVPSVDLWKRLLACFYGGIAEELLLRLGLMTVILWLLWKAVRQTQRLPTAWMVWIAIVLAAILFGVGHLPAAASVWPLNSVVVVRVIALNALGGIAFGYLYWRRGLEHAMLAHFVADILLHVVGGTA